MRQVKLKAVLFGIIGLSLLLSFSSSHPVSGGGYTGAPGDGVCAQCHTSNNTSLQGDLFIENLPASVDAGQTYSVTVRITNPSANAFRSGFQIVALDDNNNQAGSWSNNPSGTIIKSSAGRSYMGHSPAATFGGNPDISWSFDWTAPMTGTNNSDITFYAASILANGGNGNQNDRFLTMNESTTIQGIVAPLTVSVSNLIDITCFGLAEGGATASATGGTPPYDYDWDNGETGETATMLLGGSQSVTVTDDNGATATASFNINEPTEVIGTVIAVIAESCDGMLDGSAEVDAAGGTPGYTYEWSNSQTGPLLSQVAAGSYSVTILDASLCETVLFVDVPATPDLTITEFEPYAVSCLGANNGGVDVSIIGGTPGYTYLWSNGQTTEDLMNVAAGNYTLTVTDSKGCTISESVQVDNGPQVIIDATNAALDVSCHGTMDGSIDINVSGGTAPYTYDWNNGDSGNPINNLGPGLYVVTVTDAGGCTAQTTLQIQEPDEILITVNKTNVVCAGSMDGTAQVVASGGQSPYNFDWPNGSDPNMLGSGSYVVTVSDALNCTATSVVQISEQHTPIQIDFSIMGETAAGAADGSINTTVSGGVNNFGYLWSTGDTIADLSGLGAGSYTLTVTDTVGCTAVQSAIVPMGDCALTASAEITHLSCFGDSSGQITVQFSGNVGPVSFTWSNGDSSEVASNLTAGVYSVSIADSTGCTFEIIGLVVSQPTQFVVDINQDGSIVCGDESSRLFLDSPSVGRIASVVWNDTIQTDTLSINMVGTYTAMALDTNGCVAFDTIQLTGQDEEEPSVTLVSDTAYLDASGMIDFTQLWTIRDNCGIDTVNYTGSADCSMIGQSIPVSADAVDQGGNRKMVSGQVVILDTLAPVIACMDTVYGNSCDSIFLGMPTIMDNCLVTDTISTWPVGGQLLTNGTYVAQYTAFDASGNEASCSTTVIIEDKISTIVEVVDVSCFGESDGSITVTEITGLGTEDFTIDISGGRTDSLSAGSYVLSISDTLGCSWTDTIDIVEPELLKVDSVEINHASAADEADGTIGVLVSGGAQPYSFEWQDSMGMVRSTNSFVVKLEPGDYTLRIVDSNGCMVEETYTVLFPTSAEESLFADLRIYPNPVRNWLEIGGYVAGMRYELRDVQGQRVAIGQQRRIDLSGLASGLYVLRISSEAGSVSKLVIRE